MSVSWRQGKTVWVYEGWQPNDADMAKISAHEIVLVFLDPRSANAGDVIQQLHARGVGYGIYFDPGWYKNGQDVWPGPLAAARLASGHLSRLGLNASGIPIMFDLETTDIAWVRAFFAAWRVLRPLRDTAYTNAPFQGGYVPTLTLRLARAHCFLQVYYGTELPNGDLTLAEAGAVVLEQTRRGLPPAMTHVFYAGEELPTDARDGCIFTLERIPT